MIYRPQYAFFTPPGFQDEAFHYSFDQENVPVLGIAIAAGVVVRDITLQLQNDAEFILRAIKVQVQSGTAVSNLNIVIRDPYGNYLAADRLPLNNYVTGGGGAIIGRMLVPFESEVRAPIGGFFQLSIGNPTLGSLQPPALTLYGVNRREIEAA